MDLLNHTEILNKLNSPEGRQLISYIQNSSGTALSKAAAAARSGNYQLAKELLEPVLSGTDAEMLARSLEKKHG